MFKIIIAFLLGMVGGLIVTGSSRTDGQHEEPVNTPMSKKEQNIEQLIELFHAKSRVYNRDAVGLLGVSAKTARNYFTELERRNLIEQKGMTGRDVYYIAKEELR